MPVGQMRERVIIQQESNVSDGMGGVTLGWSAVATVWARVAPLRGMEAQQARQVQDVQSYKVTMRYRSDVTPKMRLVWGSKTLNIRAVINPDEKSRYSELLCDEGVGE